MYYVCIDTQENIISSILDYKPNTPPYVKVVEISDKEYDSIEKRTHFFSIELNKVVPLGQQEKDKLAQDKLKADAKILLESTDWKVLRHIREKALGTPTTLSEQEYLELESQRAQAASII